MTRPRPEWIGKRDDSMPPPRVRLRIFDREKGVCHWCKLPIKVPAESWQADHVVAIINGGENVESNLAPIHAHCHVEKTGRDVSEKAKVTATRKAHLGIKAAKRPIQSRGFPKAEKPAPKPTLPPRRLYAAE